MSGLINIFFIGLLVYILDIDHFGVQLSEFFLGIKVGVLALFSHRNQIFFSFWFGLSLLIYSRAVGRY